MGELDDRVNEAIRVAFKLTMITGACIVCSYMGYQNLASTGAFKQEEKQFSYESDEVRALANSAMKKYGCSECQIDNDKNSMITELEVLNYVRNH
jgi:hypothetical protein